MTKPEARLFKVEFKDTDAPILNDEMRDWLENYWRDSTGYITISLDELEEWGEENEEHEQDEEDEAIRPLYDWLIQYLKQANGDYISFEVL